VQVLGGLLQAANQMTAMSYRLHGWDRLLHPPVENPRNLVDAGLAMALHKVRDTFGLYLGYTCGLCCHKAAGIVQQQSTAFLFVKQSSCTV
jgi:hypothetical protein